LQECVPEDVDIKKKVFGQIDDLMDDDTIVASSSSCLTATMFAEDFKHRQNMLVAHPVCMLVVSCL
jgi:L-gulonate 3-dehydrogenase